ncbi:MAG: ABC transporter substrate-binding protein [Chloroflexi bacterium]|nr:ABC transporter substrate-binding protein [Chloroflexota bacterium]
MLLAIASCASPNPPAPPIAKSARVFSTAPSPGDYVIGMSAAFTGPSAGLGNELYRGTAAYLEYINRNGGVNGHRVVVRAYDDGYNPNPAIDNTVDLIQTDDVLVLMDYVGTPTVTRVLPLLKKYSDSRVSLLFPFTGAQPQREPPYDEFVFNLRASYRDETEGLVDRLVSAGRKKIAVFFQADSYGRSGWDGVKRALAKRGLELAGEATYRRGTPYSASLGEQVNILRKAGPDAIISIGAYAACAAFVRDARDAGWDVPIANVSFVGSGSLLDLLLDSGRQRGKDYTANLINSEVVPSFEDASLPAVREYRQMMDEYEPTAPSELTGGQYKPLKYSPVSLEGFLNAKVLVAALGRMTGTSGREALMGALESLDGVDIGIGIPITFGPRRHQGLNAVYYTSVENGRFVPIRDWRRWAK